MGIVTAHAGLADGAIGVNGLKVGLIADRHCTSGRLFRMFTNRL